MALSMMQEMAIRDDDGRCRCPWCGKFRREEDFETQPGHLVFGSGMQLQMHIAPKCKGCMAHSQHSKANRH
jgi:hypothetical protein